jgi:hypothetical protein
MLLSLGMQLGDAPPVPPLLVLVVVVNVPELPLPPEHPACG